MDFCPHCMRPATFFKFNLKIQITSTKLSKNRYNFISYHTRSLTRKQYIK